MVVDLRAIQGRGRSTRTETTEKHEIQTGSTEKGGPLSLVESAKGQRKKAFTPRGEGRSRRRRFSSLRRLSLDVTTAEQRTQ